MFVEVLVHALSTLGLGFDFYSTLDPKYKVRNYFYYLDFIQGLRENIYSSMYLLLALSYGV